MTSRALRTALVAATATAALLLSACSGASAPAATDGALETVTAGKLTVATGQPAYAPWVIDDKPESGEGLEPAVAYAVAEKLGFAAEDVVWVRAGFDESIAPGPKAWDLNLQQFSATDERHNAVDFSSPYYLTAQAVVTSGDSAVAGATSLADLAGAKIGAAVGSTSATAATEIIAPTTPVAIFNSNDDAVLALQSGQVDALVVDVPTAFYMVGAQLDESGKILGTLDSETGDGLSIVLPKGSALTAPVTAAVDELRDAGTLDELATTWLSDSGKTPVLK